MSDTSARSTVTRRIRLTRSGAARPLKARCARRGQCDMLPAEQPLAACRPSCRDRRSVSVERPRRAAVPTEGDITVTPATLVSPSVRRAARRRVTRQVSVQDAARRVSQGDFTLAGILRISSNRVCAARSTVMAGSRSMSRQLSAGCSIAMTRPMPHTASPQLSDPFHLRRLRAA